MNTGNTGLKLIISSDPFYLFHLWPKSRSRVTANMSESEMLLRFFVAITIGRRV